MALPGFTPKEMITTYCDVENKEAGKQMFDWWCLDPENEPSTFTARNSITSVLGGPSVTLGQRYRIVYRSPARLPFLDPSDDSTVVLHVAEITGTLSNIYQLTDIEGILCDVKDYEQRASFTAPRTVFRLFDGDTILPQGSFETEKEQFARTGLCPKCHKPFVMTYSEEVMTNSKASGCPNCGWGFEP
jgi:ssDNA-binding Zn-finger/Zn-ribbon topoisomerase 1